MFFKVGGIKQGSQAKMAGKIAVGVVFASANMDVHGCMRTL